MLILAVMEQRQVEAATASPVSQQTHSRLIFREPVSYTSGLFMLIIRLHLPLQISQYLQTSCIPGNLAPFWGGFGRAVDQYVLRFPLTWSQWQRIQCPFLKCHPQLLMKNPFCQGLLIPVANTVCLPLTISN